jgi:hypothetical protein
MMRNATLSVGASLQTLAAERRLNTPVVIGGVMATGGLVAIAYLIGADLRPWLATQPGVLPTLLDTLSIRDPSA